MRLFDIIVGSGERTDCFSWYSQSYTLMQRAGRSVKSVSGDHPCLYCSVYRKVSFRRIWIWLNRNKEESSIVHIHLFLWTLMGFHFRTHYFSFPWNVLVNWQMNLVFIWTRKLGSVEINVRKKISVFDCIIRCLKKLYMRVGHGSDQDKPII